MEIAVLMKYGYAGVFAAGFLAATLLPVSSEGVLVYLLSEGLTPLWLLLAATAGNLLGAVFNYWLGQKGNFWMLHKLLRMSDEDIRKAEKRFEKYGKLAMLLAWVPVISDPLTVVAGLFRMNFYWFVLLVGAGKLVRYWVLIWGALALLKG